MQLLEQSFYSLFQQFNNYQNINLLYSFCIKNLARCSKSDWDPITLKNILKSKKGLHKSINKWHIPKIS